MQKLNVKRAITFAAAVWGLAASTQAFAYDWSVETTVTTLEVTYMPGRIAFAVTSAAGTCPAGTMLTWIAKGADQPTQIANAQAAYATLLTAKMSGKTVRVYGNNVGCTIDFMHIL